MVDTNDNPFRVGSGLVTIDKKNDDIFWIQGGGVPIDVLNTVSSSDYPKTHWLRWDNGNGDLLFNIINVDTIQFDFTISGNEQMNGNKILTGGEQVEFELNAFNTNVGAVKFDDLTGNVGATPNRVGISNIIGYGSERDNGNVSLVSGNRNGDPRSKFQIIKIGTNTFRLNRLDDNIEFPVVVEDSEPYNGLAWIAGNKDLQTNLPDAWLEDFTNFSRDFMRRLDRTVDKSFQDGVPKNLEPVVMGKNNNLFEVQLYNKAVISYAVFCLKKKKKK